MKTLLNILAASSLILHSTSFAAPNTYQVTGTVLEVNDTMIAVQSVKDKTRWELARTADTKVTGEPKVGAKVTIQYAMTAQTIEAKEEKAGKGATPTKAPAAKK